MPAGDKSESQILPGRDRVIHVFISSTFRDIMRERDILIKNILPQLRKMREERAVTWTEVDLRWGITDEQVDNDRALEICLRQIDECRPFFVGVIGERYGRVPRRFPVEALERYGWVQHHTGKSVTELENRHN